MIKILLDTSVWMSYLGRCREKSSHRIEKAKNILDLLNANTDKIMICYSERTKRELSNYSSESVLETYYLLPSHILNQNWEETEENYDNIGTKHGDEEEYELGKRIEDILPDKKKKLNRNDRGIVGDAIHEGCQIIIHENPKDFDRFANFSDNLIIIDLISNSVEEATDIITQSMAVLKRIEL